MNRALSNDGWRVVSNPSLGLLREYEDSGLDWANYQQDYLVFEPGGTDNVKLTFVVTDPENQRQLDASPDESIGPRVATVAEIFRLKCIAAADRSKSRDWLDLYLLLKSGAFDAADFIAAYERAGSPIKRNIALGRMTSGALSARDEGFRTLLEIPPTLEEIRQYFVGLSDDVQQLLARRAFGA